MYPQLKKIITLWRKLPPLRTGWWLAGVLLWLVILAVAWWAGPRLVISTHHPLVSVWSRVTFTLIWLLLAAATVLWYFWRRLEQMKLTVQSYTAAAEDPGQKWLNQQQQFLDTWLHTLRNYAGAGILYKLPWYLIIGLPDSGKTSLINRANPASRLNIRLNSQLRDLAKNQYIDSWVGGQAVIFDPKGQLLTQQGQDDENADEQQQKYTLLWHHLLHWLNENRKRQPLNGVILTLDLAWLAQSSVAQRKSYAQLIKVRLLDLTASLNTRLPLYIVLTRLDLLEGFENFYQQTDKTMRQSLLGVTFTLQQGSADSWLQQLNQFWQQWTEQLNHQLAHQLLAHTGETETEMALFSFIRQVAGLYDYIKDILDDAIIQEPHHLLTIRGVYLSSVWQQGVPCNVFSRAAAQRYQLPPSVNTAQRGESNVFFVHKLFTDIIFPQAHLAGESRLHQLYRRRRLSLGGGVMALLAVVVLAGWQHFYRINSQASQTVLEKVRQFTAITDVRPVSAVTGGTFGTELLPQLNALHDATLSSGSYRDKTSLFADMGLYQGDKLGPFVENSYLRLLQLKFLPAIMQALQQDLQQAPPMTEEKLNILRIMRMTEDRSGRDKSQTEQFMSARWQKAFPDQGHIQQQLMTHLDYALDHTDWRAARQRHDQAAITAWQPFEHSVRLAQQELSKLPLFLRVYQSMSAQTGQSMPADLHIENSVGQTFHDVFILRNNNTGTIPAFFGWQGLQGNFTGEHKTLFNITAQDAWVLGLKERVYLSDADWKEIERQVQDRYITDYISHWQNLLADLDVQPLKTPEQALHVLSEITSNEQPLRRVIQALSDNTQTRTQSADKDKQTESIIRRIAGPFTAINGTLISQQDKAATIQQANQKVTDLYQWLEQITSTTDPGKAALQALQQRLVSPYKDPGFLLQQYARTLPPPLNRWLQQISQQVSALTVNLAMTSLNQDWQKTVIEPFEQDLAHRYPFDTNSAEDVSLSDMEHFFARGGILDSFYQTSIRPLVDAGMLDGSTSPKQAELLRQIKRADRIRDTLFNSQGSLEYHFVVEPLELTANKRRSVLNLDGQLVDYSHGRRQKIPLIWPNALREGAESKLTLMSDDKTLSPRSIRYSGAWALFRLTDSARLLRITADSFDVSFTVDGGSMTYRIYTDENRNPFTRDLFSQFMLPDTLY